MITKRDVPIEHELLHHCLLLRLVNHLAPFHVGGLCIVQQNLVAQTVKRADPVWQSVFPGGILCSCDRISIGCTKRFVRADRGGRYDSEGIDITTGTVGMQEQVNALFDLPRSLVGKRRGENSVRVYF